MKKKLLPLISILLAAALTACSQEMSTLTGEKNAIDGAAAGEGAGAGADRADDIGAADAPIFNKIEDEAGELKGDELFGEIEAEGDSVGADGIIADDRGSADSNITPAAGLLTAGEWIDNNHYTFWKDLFQKTDTGWETYRKLWDRAFCSRAFVTVTHNGKLIENETVILKNSEGKTLWTAKTDNAGSAYLFYNPSELSKGNLTLTASSGESADITADNASKAHSIEIGSDKQTQKSLDLSLIVDTTGSMSDELNYIQKELENVIERAAKGNGNIPVRLSVSFYRDDGDEYVVRSFDFTDNISEAVKKLSEQWADGGGDTPEKVNKALDNAINSLSWNENSTKLMFILLDAPPHSEDKEAISDMNLLTEQAAAKGIRLIPILASGGDKETEFLMRDFALKTGGTYLFLTDDSGISTGQHIEPTIGDYTVEKLNDLMVNVINRYLQNVTAAPELIDIPVDDPIVVPETTQSANPVEPIEEITGEITMTLKTIKGKEEGLTASFDIENGTNVDYNYGLAFGLEKLSENKGWVKLEMLPDTPIIEIAVISEAGKTNEFVAPVGEYFGKLKDGSYRIVLNASSAFDSRTLYAEFGIGVSMY